MMPRNSARVCATAASVLAGVLLVGYLIYRSRRRSISSESRERQQVARMIDGTHVDERGESGFMPPIPEEQMPGLAAEETDVETKDIKETETKESETIEKESAQASEAALAEKPEEGQPFLPKQGRKILKVRKKHKKGAGKETGEDQTVTDTKSESNLKDEADISSENKEEPSRTQDKSSQVSGMQESQEDKTQSEGESKSSSIKPISQDDDDEDVRARSAFIMEVSEGEDAKSYADMYMKLSEQKDQLVHGPQVNPQTKALINYRFANVCYQYGRQFDPCSPKRAELIIKGCLAAEECRKLGNVPGIGYKPLKFLLALNLDELQYSESKAKHAQFERLNAIVDGLKEKEQKDPFLQHCIGRFYMEYYEYAKDEMKKPPNEEFLRGALHFLKKAKAAFYPSVSVENCYFLARAYMAAGEEANAKSMVQETSSLSLLNVMEQHYMEQLLKMLSDSEYRITGSTNDSIKRVEWGAPKHSQPSAVPAATQTQSAELKSTQQQASSETDTVAKNVEKESEKPAKQ